MDVRDYEAMWEAAGARVSGATASRHSVAVLGDDPAATGAVALGIARLQGRTRRVYVLDLLGDGQGIVPLEDAERCPGVSDMVHYGVSLRHAARRYPGTLNVWVVGGGAESPLAVDVLTDRWWEVVSDQVRRARGLLIVAAPAMVPAMGQLVMRLDGIVLVGEASAPSQGADLLAEVRSEAALSTPPSSSTVRAAGVVGATSRRRRLPLVAAAILVLAVAAGIISPGLRSVLRLMSPGDVVELPPIPAPAAAPPSPPVATNEASYSVELLFTNSDHDAIDYIARRGDSLPAITFSTLTFAGDTAQWFRLVAGAFPDSIAATRFLGELREAGVVATGAGAVSRTPFALLLDSATSDAIAQVRVAAYRGRGIPAYSLRDSTQIWHVYAGAFPREGDAQWLKQQLDSVNIQSALVMRAGSTR